MIEYRWVLVLVAIVGLLMIAGMGMLLMLVPMYG